MENSDDPLLNVLIQGREKVKADLEEQLNTFQKAIGERKNALLRTGTTDYKAVQPGQFSGMDTKAALLVYLTARGGGPITVEQVAIDLTVGGAKMGNPNRYERNLKIVAGNNKGTFIYDKDTDTLSLVNPPKKKTSVSSY